MLRMPRSNGVPSELRLSLRTNFSLAMIPLGLALLARGVEELDRLIAGRYRRLADVESQLAARELTLGNLDEPAERSNCECGGWHADRACDLEAAAAAVP